MKEWLFALLFFFFIFSFFFFTELNDLKLHSGGFKRWFHWQAQMGSAGRAASGLRSNLEPDLSDRGWTIKCETNKSLLLPASVCVLRVFFVVVLIFGCGNENGCFPEPWMKELMTEAVISGLQPSSDLRSALSDGVCCKMKRAALTPAASRLHDCRPSHDPLDR